MLSSLLEFFLKDHIIVEESGSSEKRHQINIKYDRYRSKFWFYLIQINQIKPHAYGLNMFDSKFDKPEK